MNYTVGLSLSLMLGVAADAAEPTTAGPTWKAPAANVSPQPVGDPSRKRLDLRAGKIQNLMMPRDLEALMKAPDFEKDAVIVEGNRVLLPMKFEEPIPGGFPPATLWWALKNPSQSWRILLPDLNTPAAGPTVDKVPPREFRWGP
jgi:hypothetical protein